MEPAPAPSFGAALKDKARHPVTPGARAGAILQQLLLFSDVFVRVGLL